MIPSLSRRSFIATTALAAASLGLPRGAWAATPKPLKLTATSRTLDIDGRAATVWGLVNAQGGSGLTLDPGARFRVDLTNALDVDTIIHWHGQTPPPDQDGVTDTGYVNFTDFLPSELDDIEKLVGKGGMVQQYPPISEEDVKKLELELRNRRRDGK